MILLFIAVENY